MKKTITLYRPVGQKELDLVEQSGFRQWPARLPEQPVFYPVTNEGYAIEVNNWNVKSQGVGYITRFEVLASFMSNYTIETVGAKHHTEWWIPAADLEELNRNIVGTIEVIGKYTEVIK